MRSTHYSCHFTVHLGKKKDFRKIFEKYQEYQISLKSHQSAELFHADGRTDRHDNANTRSS